MKSFSIWLFLLITLYAFTSCQNQSDKNVITQQKQTIDSLLKSSNSSYYIAYFNGRTKEVNFYKVMGKVATFLARRKVVGTGIQCTIDGSGSASCPDDLDVDACKNAYKDQGYDCKNAGTCICGSESANPQIGDKGMIYVVCDCGEGNVGGTLPEPGSFTTIYGD